MKYVWKLVQLILKIAVLIAGIIVAMECIDAYSEKNHHKYLITEDLAD